MDEKDLQIERLQTRVHEEKQENLRLTNELKKALSGLESLNEKLKLFNQLRDCLREIERL